MTRIGVIADTHGYFDPQIPDKFAAVDLIIHGGDVGGLRILQQLAAIAPVVSVLGNVDPETDCGYLPEAAWVSLCGVDIYVTHIFTPPDGPQPSAAPSGAGVVIFGHSHQQYLSEHAGALYFNPASAGKKRFRNPRSLGLLEQGDSGAVDARFISLEKTG